MRARFVRTPGFSLAYQLKISRMRSFIVVSFSPHRGAEAPALPGIGRKRRLRSRIPLAGSRFSVRNGSNRALTGLCDAHLAMWLLSAMLFKVSALRALP